MSHTQLRFIRSNLYALKREYGLRIDFYKLNTATYNLETGVKTLTKTVHTVKRGIRLPRKLVREFDYDLTYVRANVNFVYGALFDLANQIFIVDKRDLKSFWPITLDHYMVIEGHRYNIKEATEFEHGEAVLIVGTKTVGAPVTEIFNRLMVQFFPFTETISATL